MKGVIANSWPPAKVGGFFYYELFRLSALHGSLLQSGLGDSCFNSLINLRFRKYLKPTGLPPLNIKWAKAISSTGTRAEYGPFRARHFQNGLFREITWFPN
jgi:hypothetical protein